ncbi:alpha-2,8-sialyltransferase 8F-like [Discoglossus pictus]
MALRKRKLLYLPVFLFAISLYSFYTNIQRRAHFCMILEDQPPQLDEKTCYKLKNTILRKSLKMVKTDIVIKSVTGLQHCPWIPNSKHHRQIRSELQTCCDAKSSFLVSQNNTQIGSILNYEIDKNRKIYINEKIHHMLPEVACPLHAGQQRTVISALTNARADNCAPEKSAPDNCAPPCIPPCIKSSLPHY